MRPRRQTLIFAAARVLASPEFFSIQVDRPFP
jgi:hypothetical protein